METIFGILRECHRIKTSAVGEEASLARLQPKTLLECSTLARPAEADGAARGLYLQPAEIGCGLYLQPAGDLTKP